MESKITFPEASVIKFLRSRIRQICNYVLSWEMCWRILCITIKKIQHIKYPQDDGTQCACLLPTRWHCQENGRWNKEMSFYKFRWILRAVVLWSRDFDDGRDTFVIWRKDHDEQKSLDLINSCWRNIFGGGLPNKVIGGAITSTDCFREWY